MDQHNAPRQARVKHVNHANHPADAAHTSNIPGAQGGACGAGCKCGPGDCQAACNGRKGEALRVFDDGGVGVVEKKSGKKPRVAGRGAEMNRAKASAGGASDTDSKGSDRRDVIDRRLGVDRRDLEDAKASEQEAEIETEDEANPFESAGFERRRGAGRRLADHLKDAEEGELSKEQFLFLMAIEAFKKANQKMFPAWTDVLEVVRLLGYRKTMAMELKLTSAEDWIEPANEPSNVRAPRWQRHDPRSKAA